MKANLTNSEIQEATELIRIAQEQIREAVQMLNDANDILGDSRDKTLIADIEIANSDDHDWLTGSNSLDKWLSEIEEAQVEESEDTTPTWTPEIGDHVMINHNGRTGEITDIRGLVLTIREDDTNTLIASFAQLCRPITS